MKKLEREEIKNNMIKILLKKVNRLSFENRRGSFGVSYNKYFLCGDGKMLIHTERLSDSFLGASYLENISNKKGCIILSIDNTGIYPANKPTEEEMETIYQIFRLATC